MEGLMAKELVSQVGRSQAIGRPILYGTTDKFLKNFGFKSIKDLPEIEDIETAINVEVYDENNKVVHYDTYTNDSQTIHFDVEHPHLWSAEKPYLYTMIITIPDHEVVVQKIGLREFKMDQGIMKINGKRIVFNGVNRHEFSPKHGRALTKEEIYNEESLKKYGLLPEFIGRNDTLVVLNSLEIPDLEKIIRESDKSQLLLYKYAFENIGVDFKYDDDTIAAIAKKAKELNLGARSIKKIVENALSIANYQLLSSEQYSSLTISPKTIEDPHQFVLKK